MNANMHKSYPPGNHNVYNFGGYLWTLLPTENGVRACVLSLWRNNAVCLLCAPPIIAVLPESPAKNAVFRLYSALYGAIHEKLFHVKHFAFAAY